MKRITFFIKNDCCQSIKKFVEKIAIRANTPIDYVLIDSEQGAERAKKAAVISAPTIIIYGNDLEVARLSNGDEIERRLKDFLDYFPHWSEVSGKIYTGVAYGAAVFFTGRFLNKFFNG
jgi:hypothetical protein